MKLFTPAHANSLEGMPYPDDPWHFPGKDEFAGYLELYAVTHDLPVWRQTRVERLSGRDGGFTADFGPDEITCDNAVIVTGTFGRTPRVPGLAAEVGADTQQLHSSEYRHPGQLPDGPALVVGASHSGLDIAYELAATRLTTLVGPQRGKVPLEWGLRRFRRASP